MPMKDLWAHIVLYRFPIWNARLEKMLLRQGYPSPLESIKSHQQVTERFDYINYPSQRKNRGH